MAADSPGAAVVGVRSPSVTGCTTRRSCTISHPSECAMSSRAPWCRECSAAGGDLRAVRPEAEVARGAVEQAAKTLGESGRGRHGRSTEPFGATGGKLFSQSERNP